jgi:hypothetical protein
VGVPGSRRLTLGVAIRDPIGSRALAKSVVGKDSIPSSIEDSTLPSSSRGLPRPACRQAPGLALCFDRVLFRGYLPFFSGYAMASFLETRKIPRRDVKRCVLTQAYLLKDHARQMAAREGRPYQYFFG